MNHLNVITKKKYEAKLKQKPELYNLLDKNSAKKMYKRLTPEMWIEQNNLIAELDKDGLEFEEVPEKYIGRENLFYKEKENQIDNAKKVIYRGVVGYGWVSPDHHSIDSVITAWGNICETNSARAIRELDKLNTTVLSGKYDSFILKTIKDTNRATRTNIKSSYNRFVDTIIEGSRKEKDIYRAIEILVKKGALIKHELTHITDYSISENCFMSDKDRWIVKNFDVLKTKV